MSASIDIENELMVKDKNGNTHKHTQTDIDIYHMFMNSCQLQINCRELFYNIYINVNGKTSRFIAHQKPFVIS